MWSTRGDVSANEDISDPALDLLVTHVNTVVKLELLVAVMAAGNATWSLDAACITVGLTSSQLRPELDQLRASGLLRLVPGRPYRFRYEPATGVIAAAATALLDTYRRDRGTLLKMLRTIDLVRARRSPAEQLANAFLVRRPIEEGSDE
jgi:hypothetical protein